MRICSENINRFATNVLYNRRKSMKSAVELAWSVRARDNGADENEAELLRMRKENTQLREEMAKQDEHLRKENTQLREDMAKKDERIQEREDSLAKTVDNFTKEMDSLKTKNDIEAAECETEYTRFVENLIKSHRKEMDDLRNEMNSAQNIHKTFIESYVEASLDVLRKNNFYGPTL